MAWETLKPTSLFSIGGSELTAREDGAVLVSGPRPPADTYILEFEADLAGVTAVRLQTLRHDSLPFGKSGRSESGDFVVTGLEVDLLSEDDAVPLEFKSAAASFWTPGFHPAQALMEDRDGWSVMRGPSDFGLPHQAVFSLEEPLESIGVGRFRVRLRQDSALEGHLLGHFLLSLSRQAEPGAAVNIPDPVARILQTAPKQRTHLQREMLTEFYLTQAPAFKPARERRAFLHQTWTELKNPGTMVMEELAQSRPTLVHQRDPFSPPGRASSREYRLFLPGFPKGPPPIGWDWPAGWSPGKTLSPPV